MLSIIKKLKFVFVYIIGAYVRAFLKSKELKCIQNNTDRINKNDIILVAVLRNEAVRVPYFLDYYRKLGINHFLFVDNDSSDGFSEIVSKEPDISIWHTKGSYKKSKFGIDWTNYLLTKYGSDHWCLTVDPDEFLVYPHSETRDLKSLTEYLDYIGQKSLFCLLLDMYSDKKIADNHYHASEDPKKVCPYFDTSGYIVRESMLLQNLWIQGGPRMRLFFRDKPEQAPALNKMPLVRWLRHYSYQSSTHGLTPRRLNKMHAERIDLTGCLLHYKFLNLLKEKSEEEIGRKQHFAGSREYKQYLKGFDGDGLCLLSSRSAKMSQPSDLTEHGLMTTGGWF